MTKPTSLPLALRQLDTAVQICCDTQDRLNAVIDLLVRAEQANIRLSGDLSRANREIARLISERDTWRANAAHPRGGL